jgi:hypothetical protein
MCMYLGVGVFNAAPGWRLLPCTTVVAQFLSWGEGCISLGPSKLKEPSSPRHFETLKIMRLSRVGAQSCSAAPVAVTRLKALF